MDFLNVNEKMLNMRINEKKTEKFSQVEINKPGEGFSMFTEKNMIQYTSSSVGFYQGRYKENLKNVSLHCCL